MLKKSDPSCLLLREQKNFRFGLVYLLVHKFANLRISKGTDSDTRMFLARLRDTEVS